MSLGKRPERKSKTAAVGLFKRIASGSNYDLDDESGWTLQKSLKSARHESSQRVLRKEKVKKGSSPSSSKNVSCKADLTLSTQINERQGMSTSKRTTRRTIIDDSFDSDNSKSCSNQEIPVEEVAPAVGMLTRNLKSRIGCIYDIGLRRRRGGTASVTLKSCNVDLVEPRNLSSLKHSGIDITASVDKNCPEDGERYSRCSNVCSDTLDVPHSTGGLSVRKISHSTCDTVVVKSAYVAGDGLSIILSRCNSLGLNSKSIDQVPSKGSVITSSCSGEGVDSLGEFGSCSEIRDCSSLTCQQMNETSSAESDCNDTPAVDSANHITPGDISGSGCTQNLVQSEDIEVAAIIAAENVKSDDSKSENVSSADQASCASEHCTPSPTELSSLGSERSSPIVYSSQDSGCVMSSHRAQLVSSETCESSRVSSLCHQHHYPSDCSNNTVSCFLQIFGLGDKVALLEEQKKSSIISHRKHREAGGTLRKTVKRKHFPEMVYHHSKVVANMLAENVQENLKQNGESVNTDVSGRRRRRKCSILETAPSVEVRCEAPLVQVMDLEKRSNSHDSVTASELNLNPLNHNGNQPINQESIVSINMKQNGNQSKTTKSKKAATSNPRRRTKRKLEINLSESLKKECDDALFAVKHAGDVGSVKNSCSVEIGVDGTTLPMSSSVTVDEISRKSTNQLDTSADSSKLKIEMSNSRQKESLDKTLAVKNENDGYNCTVGIDRGSVSEDICLELKSPMPSVTTKKRKRILKTGMKTKKENIGDVDVKPLTTDTVESQPHSLSASDHSILLYKYNEQACRAPHMCQVCSVNDHKYSKSYKWKSEVVSSYAGCIHTVPCQHYLSRRRSNSLLERCHKSLSETETHGSCHNLTWNIVPRNSALLNSKHSSAPISSALYQAYRNIAQPGNDVIKGSPLDTVSKDCEDLFCNEVLYDSDSESLRVEDVDKQRLNIHLQIQQSKVRTACDKQNHYFEFSPNIADSSDRNKSFEVSSKDDTQKTEANGDQSFYVEPDVEIASYGAEVTIGEDVPVTSAVDEEGFGVVNKKLKRKGTKRNSAQLSRSSIPVKLPGQCENGISEASGKGQEKCDMDVKGDAHEMYAKDVELKSLQIQQGIVGSTELYRLLSTFNNSTPLCKRNDFAGTDSSCSIGADIVPQTLIRRESCNKDLLTCDSNNRSSLEKPSTESVTGVQDIKDGSGNVTRYQRWDSMTSDTNVLNVTSQFIESSIYSHSALDTSDLGGMPSQPGRSCAESTASSVGISLNLCTRDNENSRNLVSAVDEDSSTTIHVAGNVLSRFL